MNECDVVTLVKPFENLKENTSGTIVLKYDDNNFEVEFFDNNGETIDVLLHHIFMLSLKFRRQTTQDISAKLTLLPNLHKKTWSCDL